MAITDGSVTTAIGTATMWVDHLVVARHWLRTTPIRISNSKGTTSDATEGQVQLAVASADWKA
jgi:hypothetical protein